MNNLAWINEDLDALAKADLLRQRREIQPLADAWCEVNGVRLKNFASNDYLNLAHDQRLLDAASQAAQESGVGARASALVSGRSHWHTKLERQIAEFEGHESAIVFPSGFAANTGTIAALLGPQDVVFCDRLNHASLVDGCRLSEAKLRVYRHRELDVLRRELAKSANARRRMVVTDTVFSMDGDLAPLSDICDLAEEFDADVLVDEAHATGVFGKSGRGVCQLQGVEDRIAIRIGTLSKAVGCLGGFVSGSESLIKWLWNNARTQVYSTALPPAVCAAACEALSIIVSEPERGAQLRELSRHLHENLRDIDISPMECAYGPICPIDLNDPRKAIDMAEKLQSAGFLVGAIRPPTVPNGTSRLRITLSCGQSIDDIDRLVQAIAQSTCS